MTWIQTHTGRAFSLVEPRAEDVVVEDIAHHLAHLCRFTGASRRFYSVAQHSVYVAGLVPDRHQLVALLHDAHEAYLGDWSAPLKVTLRKLGIDIEPIVRAVNFAIGERFNVNLIDLPDDVKRADLVMLATEKRDLMAPEPRPWVPLPEPRIQAILRWTIEDGYVEFMSAFRACEGRR